VCVLTLLSAIVAVGCVLASARRLGWAVAPTAFDPAVLTDALRDKGGAAWRALREAVVATPNLGWERDLFEALGAADEDVRVALLNEQLLELDWLARRWARVPRVCASIATSAGFLFASVALLRGLAAQEIDVRGSLVSALDALTVGIAGTAFCAAVHVRTRRLAADRLAAADRLVDRLQALASDVETGK
jgi:hypothetical protein